MNPDNSGRASLVNVITTPLGFFALSLLIVEGFLGIVLIASGMPGNSKFIGMIIGTGLFVLVVAVVATLVWFKPESLTFGEKSYLEKQKMLGDPVNLMTEKELQAEPKIVESQTSEGSTE
jgi:hypothetical protein